MWVCAAGPGFGASGLNLPRRCRAHLKQASSSCPHVLSRVRLWCKLADVTDPSAIRGSLQVIPVSATHRSCVIPNRVSVAPAARHADTNLRPVSGIRQHEPDPGDKSPAATDCTSLSKACRGGADLDAAWGQVCDEGRECRTGHLELPLHRQALL